MTELLINDNKPILLQEAGLNCTVHTIKIL